MFNLKKNSVNMLPKVEQQTLMEKVKDYKEIIGLVASIFSVVAGIILFAISYNLAPIREDISLIKNEVLANDKKDEKDHPTFVTRDLFNEYQKNMEDKFGAIQTTLRDIDNYLRGK